MDEIKIDTLREDEYLEHYGREGMKWGQHIFGGEDVRQMSSSQLKEHLKNVLENPGTHGYSKKEVKVLKKEARKRINERKKLGLSKKAESKESDSTKTASKKSIKDMTDKELNDAIDRKKLETRYREAFPEPKSKKAAAKDLVKEIGSDVVKKALMDAGKKALTNYATAKMNDVLGVSVKKDIGPVLNKIAKESPDLAKMLNKKK